MCMCVNVYVCVCAYKCVWVCVCMFVCVPTSVCVCFCMCAYKCAWVCMCAYKRAWVCGSQKSTLSIVSCVLGQGLSLDLELPDQARLLSQQAPGIPLSLPLQCWDYKCMTPHLFDMGFGTRTQVFMLAWQAFYQCSGH